MGAAMLLMAAGMRLPALAHLGPYVAVLGTLAYILSFSLGVGPVPALLVPEITPVNLRGARGVASAASAAEGGAKGAC